MSEDKYKKYKGYDRVDIFKRGFALLNDKSLSRETIEVIHYAILEIFWNMDKKESLLIKEHILESIGLDLDSSSYEIKTELDNKLKPETYEDLSTWDQMLNDIVNKDDCE